MDAALALAREELPHLDPDRYRAQAQAWAEHVGSLPNPPIEALQHTLFVEVGFGGNRDDYYAPDNSLIPRVMDERLGLPITLAVVFVDVAQRLGLDAYGISFPGHFLAGLNVEGGTLFVDCFDGVVVQRKDLDELLCRVMGSPARIEPRMLEPATPQEVTLRMLANLHHAYLRRGDFVRAITALDRSLVVRPEQPDMLRERGLAHAHVGLLDAARQDLEGYLAMRPGAGDRERVKRVLKRCQEKRDLFN